MATAAPRPCHPSQIRIQNSKFKKRGATLVLVFALHAGALAQNRPAVEPPGSLAAFVPADCGMFLQLERPAHLSETLQRADAWRSLDLILADEHEGAPPVQWHDLLLAELSGPVATALMGLAEKRVAVAGPGWSRLTESVLLFPADDRAALDRLLAAAAPAAASRDGQVEVHELAGGMKLAHDGRVGILARPRSDAAVWSRCLDLLKSDRAESLQRAPLFSREIKRLPRAAAQGVCYFTAGETGAARSGWGPWPALRGGVVAVYARGNRLDFMLRATPAGPPGPEGPRVALPRVHHLPRSTLAAWAGSVNVEAMFARWVESPAAGDADSGYLRFLRSQLDAIRLRRDVVGLLGPRAIFVWGRGAEVDPSSASLAVLLESTDADAVKQALDSALDGLVVAVNREYAHDDDERLRAAHEEHLGTGVTVVELAGFASRAESEGPARRLAAAMRPCYAALDGWLVAASAPDHLRELIAAHNGVRPVLGEFADVGGLGATRLGATAVGVLQPATAAAVIGEWLDQADRDPESLLNPESWDAWADARGPGAGGGLGLGLKPRHRAGRVLVLKVYEDGPCHSRVHVGDEIVAVNGSALALDEPNADLRRRLKELDGKRPATLRLERAGELVEVEVAFAGDGPEAGGLMADALRALRRFQAVIRPLTLATFVVTQSDAERYSAQLHLRFSENPASRPAAP